MKNYINDNYKIDFPIPNSLQYLIDIAERADKDGDEGKYWSYCEGIDTLAKNCYADGVITKGQWEILTMRYS